MQNQNDSVENYFLSFPFLFGYNYSITIVVLPKEVVEVEENGRLYYL